MEIGYTEEHEALRNKLRAYYEQLHTPEVVEQLQVARRQNRVDVLGPRRPIARVAVVLK